MRQFTHVLLILGLQTLIPVDDCGVCTVLTHVLILQTSKTFERNFIELYDKNVFTEIHP